MPVELRRKDGLKWTQAESTIGDIIRRGFKPLGSRLADFIRARGPQDTRKFVNSVGFRISGRGLRTRMIVYASDAKAEWVEKGREAGKQPPLENVLSWVRRKGLGARVFSIKTRRPIARYQRPIRTRRELNGKQVILKGRRALIERQWGIAFVIARKIGRVGLPNPDSCSTIGYGFFKNLRRDQGPVIASHIARLRTRIANELNEVR